MKKYSLYFLMFFLNISVFGQQTGNDDYQIKDYLPKSPEAAAFLRYGEYNVNKSSGLANISLPLYNLQAGEYDLPITLDYASSSGIRVNEEATWVGLGWNLNVGAQIVLEVRDTPDEHVQQIMPNLNNVQTLMSQVPYWDFANQIITNLTSESWIKDVYNFRSPTGSGKFIIGDSEDNNKVIIYPPDAFKVELIGLSTNANRRFKITDKLGNQYLFTDTRETSGVVGVSGALNYTTAWLVDKIITPSNEEINFNYINDGWLSKLSLNNKLSTTYAEETSCSERIGTISSLQSNNRVSVTKTFKVSTITFKNQRIVFDSQTGRLDLASPSQLAQQIYPNENVPPRLLKFLKVEFKKDNSSEYEFVKGFEFEYSYFDSGQFSNAEYYNKRLKLTKVSDMIDSSDNMSFVYSPLSIPSKDSMMMDAWGYYNAKSNTSLMPNQFIYYNTGLVPILTMIGDADRSVVPNVLEAGILKEIHYPAKGYTKFIHEPNDYYGQEKLDKFKKYIISGNLVQGTGSASSLPNQLPGPGYTPICNAPNPVNCVQYLVLPFTAVNGTGQISFQINNDGTIPSAELKEQYARVRILNEGGYAGAGTSLGEIYDSEKKVQNETIIADVGNINSGAVVIEVYGAILSVSNLQFKYQYEDSSYKNVFGPGLRIKSIENYTDSSTLAKKKNFTYRKFDDQSKSSGKLVYENNRLFDPDTFYNHISLNCNPDNNGNGVIHVWKTTQTKIYYGQSNYFLQNSILYTDIKEENIDFTNSFSIGYEKYKFNFIPIAASQDSNILIEYDWIRGEILNKTVFNSQGNKVLEEINTYDDLSFSSLVSGFKLSTKHSFASNQTANFPINYLSVHDDFENQGYTYYIPFHYLKTKTIKEFFYDSNSTLSGEVENTTNYSYNNTNHLQLTSEIKNTSLSDTITRKYYYAHDTDNQLLVAKNMVGVPLKTEVFKGLEKLSTIETFYKDWGNGLVALEFLKGAKGTNAIENRIKYNAYDNYGHPLEVQQENGTVISYLWGYNQSQPIAKIENATNAQIKSALGITDLNLVSEANLVTINNLRTNTSFANAMITTYTYIPLVGITSVTDPKGDKMTYIYDDFNRLKEVRDKNNNILSENEYHYRTQN